MEIFGLMIAASWILGGGYAFALTFRHPVPRGEEPAGLVVALLGIAALVGAIYAWR